MITFSELVAQSGNYAVAFKNDRWNSLMNSPPHKSWIKEHPLIKVKNDKGNMVPLQYLPIDKVEFLLTKIFTKWRVEVKSVQAHFNSEVVIVRLHVLNPETNEWEWQDGVGSAGVQTDKGAAASDLSAIKLSAVQMAAPSAESYAVKDAAEKFGTIFGKDLNRRDTILFVPGYSAIKLPNDTLTIIPPAQPLPQAKINTEIFTDL
jgi:hypothetical protein